MIGKAPEVDGQSFAGNLAHSPKRQIVDDARPGPVQFRQVDRQAAPRDQALEVADAMGDAGEEVGLAFVQAAVPVGAQRLHHTDQGVTVIVREERLPAKGGMLAGRRDVVFQEFVPDLPRDVGPGILQERRHVVLKRALPPALVVDVMGASLMPHDVAGLEVAVQEEMGIRFQKERREPLEIVFEVLFVEVDRHKLQEVVLEVVQVPPDGLRVEPAPGITDREVQVRRRGDLETGQVVEHLPVYRHHSIRESVPSSARAAATRSVQGLVTQVLLQVDALFQVRGVDLGHR